MRRAPLSRPSTRSATAVGATLVMLGAGLLVPSLAASADESHSEGDHRVVVCHHVEGQDGAYLRSVVDVHGIHGHAKHEDDIIGEEGETDLVCPGPTVSEMPEEGEDGEESTHTATPKPSHTSRPKPSHTSTPKPSHSHSESCSHSATPTPTPTETETETGTPTPTEPTTPTPTDPAPTDPTVTPTESPSETPVETDTATPVVPGTDVPSTTDPATTDPATTDPVQPGLAQTGSSPLLPMVAGILLVLVGIGAMVLGRPRGTHA